MIPVDKVPRFWSKVDQSGDCWPWIAARDDCYGQFFLGDQRLLAHRVAYTLQYGAIPEGQVIDHVCHNTKCVRPSHLRAVTHKENMENRKGAQKNSKSGVRGVCWNKHAKKWQARVWHNGKAVLVGYFHDLDVADAAVEAKRQELYTPTTKAA